MDESAIIPLVAVSDQVWLALITLGTGLVATLGAVLTGYLALRHKAMDQKLDDQQKTLERQDRKLDNQAILAQATYTFQNHAMGLQKKTTMLACQARALAEPTPENQREAKDAEQAYVDHQAGQAKVDAQALIIRAEEQARKVLEEAAAEESKKASSVEQEKEEVP